MHQDIAAEVWAQGGWDSEGQTVECSNQEIVKGVGIEAVDETATLITSPRWVVSCSSCGCSWESRGSAAT